MNWWILFVAGFVPLITGFIWYNPKVFGNVWMKASGVDPNTGKAPNRALVLGLTYLFGLMLATMLMNVVIHQMPVMSILNKVPEDMTNPNSELNVFMAAHGRDFRTFGHGAFHGALFSIFAVLPVIAIVALYERRRAKYVFVHVGYFLVTFLLMGGLLSAVL